MATTSITCYGGVGEIGGSKYLLQDGDTRLLLDFGTAFGRQGDFFNELLRPRAVRGLLDPLALGLLPPLRGLYRSDLEIEGLWERYPGHVDLRRGGQPAVDALFISHPHLDHNGDMGYLDERIPVYASRVCAFVARAMQDTGPKAVDRELTYIGPRKSDGFTIESDRKQPYTGRPHVFLDGELSPEAAAWWNKEMDVDEGEDAEPSKKPACGKGFVPGAAGAAGAAIAGLPLRVWEVDHSIPGAVGMAVQTGAGWVGYTGDIRFHGRHGEKTRRFARELADLRPAALLCEGTHLGDQPPLPEAQIVQNALPIIQQAAGKLVIADFGPRNVERLLLFIEIAQKSGRTLLAQPKDIYLLKAVSLADPGAFADPLSLPALAMYEDPKSKFDSWEKTIRAQWVGRLAGPQDVSAQPGQYILAFSFWDMADMLDMQGVSGGIYLYSNSKAYDDEQEIDLERLKSWLGVLGLALYGDPQDDRSVPLHASGHASGSELLDFVLTVKPKVLVPIHTQTPGWWQDQLQGSGIRVLPPVYGQPINL